MVEFPLLAVIPMVTTLIIYFKIGLTITAGQFWYFYFIHFLLVQCGASLGYFISCLFEHEETAVGLTGIIVMPMVLFGGQFSNSGTLQAWISWLQYVSPIRYAFEAVIINEFDNRHYDEGQYNPRLFMGFNVGMWKCLLLLACFAVILRIISLIFLRLLITKFQ